MRLAYISVACSTREGERKKKRKQFERVAEENRKVISQVKMENKCFHWNRGVFALDFTIKAIAKPSKIERMELKQKQI